MPQLSEMDAAAFMIFTDTLTQWDIAIGFGGGVRTRLIYSEAKLVAEAHGFEWTGDLLDRLRVCEAWLIQRDREEARREKDDDEQKKAAESREMVN